MLKAYWSAAATPTPTVIIGGGRWSRVWLSVICGARGNANDVVMVARTNPDDIRAWLGTQPQFDNVEVVAGLPEAIEVQPTTIAAIVASRPRDHFRDGLSALDHNLHLLIEKPLTDRASDGVKLIEATERQARILLPGTEFAYLPVFHECAAQLQARHAGVQSIQLDWSDPAGEVRYGAAKAQHEEVGVLLDILPHAVSIFGVFAPNANLRIQAASQDRYGNSATLVLTDEAGRLYELRCDKHGEARRRYLDIAATDTRAVIDFSSPTATLAMDGTIQAPSAAISEMQSTLRLQLGAFLSQISSGDRAAFVPHASQLVALHQQLETSLR